MRTASPARAAGEVGCSNSRPSATSDTPRRCHDDDLPEFLAVLAAELAAELAGYVVDFRCPDCGRRVTVRADWTERPECCDWEMVDLAGSVRRP